MATRVAWLLNLDADLELARGKGYAPSASVTRAVAAFVGRVRAALVAEDDLVIDAQTPVGAAAGCVGRAFCPTPRAIATLARAGAEPEPHPSFDVLRAVASRAFSASLGATMPKSAFVTRLDEARAILATDPAPGSGWRIKRAFGMAGRGHRVVDAAPRDADVAFLASWMEDGGAQIEPNVRVVNEYALHGFITDGAARFGALTRQRTDASGAWLASERIEAPRTIAEPIAREAERAARALAGAGYFGPFGVDAFTYESRGEVVLRARSEINARYSMGFAVGFGRP
ncbi:MAG TPA: hypothetical protein VGH28_27380 [Polyangiaceae bacterium]|jgi:hypothetical protein